MIAVQLLVLFAAAQQVPSTATLWEEAKAALDRGPDWVKTHLNPEELEQVRRVVAREAQHAAEDDDGECRPGHDELRAAEERHGFHDLREPRASKRRERAPDCQVERLRLRAHLEDFVCQNSENGDEHRTE